MKKAKAKRQIIRHSNARLKYLKEQIATPESRTPDRRFDKMENDIRYMEKAIHKNFHQEPEWEDKHPILATILTISAMLLNPVSLFFLCLIIITAIIIW